MSYYDFDEDFDIFDDYDFDDGPQKKKGKFKLIAIILAAVLAIATVVGIFVVVFNKKASAGSMVQSGLVMYETPELRLAEEKGIRFKASVSPELKQEVESDEDKTLGMLIAPLNYFLRVDVDSQPEKVDWFAEFEKEGMAVISMDDCGIVTKSQADGTIVEHYIQGSITNVMYQNTNLDFLAFAYVKTIDGEEVSYKYASYPNGINYRTQARSLAYLAADALNDNVSNLKHYSAEDLAYMKSVINNSVDLAKQLAEPTADNSVYTVTLSTTEKTLEVGADFTLKASIAEGVKLPIWWKTNDASVAIVKDGVVTATGVGETMITAFVAGEKYICVIHVTEVGEAEIDEE